MTKKAQYYSLLISALLFGCTQSAKEELPDLSHMNILFINDEDLSRRAVGSYGNADAITPNLDKLASEGIKYTNAICQSPMCNPSRASFLTGLRPESTNIFTNQDLMNEQTPDYAMGLASIVKPKGAYLANIGKLYHGREKHIRYHDFDLLAHCKYPDDYQGEVITPINSPCEGKRFTYSNNPELEAELIRRKVVFDSMNQIVLQTDERWWFEVGIPYVGMQFQLVGDSGIPEECDEDYKKARLAGEVIQRMAKGEQQFFLSVGFSKPHTPIKLPKKYLDMYDWQSIELPASSPEKDQGMLEASKRFGAGADIFTGWFDDEFPELKETPERQKKAIAAYLASATFIDAQVGYLMDQLKETGLDKNTIVIFMTDHGFHLGEHGMWSKYSIFDEVLRVPLIIKIPGVGPMEYHGLVELVDILPTICDLWNVDQPAYLEGKSLASTFYSSDPVKEYAFNVFDLKGIANKKVKGYTIRTPRYRLTQWGVNADHGVELFDFKEDPLEQRNVAADGQYAIVRDSLQRVLSNHYKF